MNNSTIIIRIHFAVTLFQQDGVYLYFNNRSTRSTKDEGNEILLLQEVGLYILEL
jgi:hypothetical protein